MLNWKVGECVLIYSAKKVVAWVIVLLGAMFVVFMTVDFMPLPIGAVTIGCFDATPEALQAWRELHGLQYPILIRYTHYIIGVIQGDLGFWSRGHDPTVTPIITQNLTYTLRLALASLSTSLALALPISALTATRKSERLDKAIKYITIIGNSLPIFLLGMLLIAMQRLPIISGPGNSLILPSLTLGIGIFCAMLPKVHASFAETIEQSYILAARAKGLSTEKVLRKHALRNILVPTMTAIRAHIGALFNGIIIVEYMFNRPGIGRLLMQGIVGRNYALVLACVTVFILLYASISIFMDIAQAIIDPRIKVMTNTNYSNLKPNRRLTWTEQV